MKEIKIELSRLGIEINDEMCGKLYHFYELVVEKNKVMNLTAITEYHDFITKHIVDSLSLCLLNEDSQDFKKLLDSKDFGLLDLGTGAGFPGIPIAVCCPNSRAVLMDSLNKRIAFINESVAELSLKNVTAVHYRAEEAAKIKDYRESFDLVTSRAVANLSTLSEYSLPFTKVGGYFLSYKGEDSEKEIEGAQKAIKILGGKIECIKAFRLPGTNYHRNLILIKKIKATPKKYPRRPGTPKNSPL